MYVKFCNEAKSGAFWLVNETLWYETETRPRHLIFSLRQDRDRDLPRFPRDWDETETFGNYVSKPRRRDRVYIAGYGSVFCCNCRQLMHRRSWRRAHEHCWRTLCRRTLSQCWQNWGVLLVATSWLWLTSMSFGTNLKDRIVSACRLLESLHWCLKFWWF